MQEKKLEKRQKITTQKLDAAAEVVLQMYLVLSDFLPARLPRTTCFSSLCMIVSEEMEG